MFAALEVKTGETDHDVVGCFFSHAETKGLKFKVLEPYGRFTLGMFTFLRFKTDCTKVSELISLFQEENRAVVLLDGAKYIVYKKASRGTVRISIMNATRTPGYERKYRGTSDKFWRRQF